MGDMGATISYSYSIFCSLTASIKLNILEIILRCSSTSKHGSGYSDTTAFDQFFAEKIQSIYSALMGPPGALGKSLIGKKIGLPLNPSMSLDYPLSAVAALPFAVILDGFHSAPATLGELILLLPSSTEWPLFFTSLRIIMGA